MQNINLPDPVLWFEGMPLLPHHFQQESIHYHSLHHIQLQILGGFNYGVLELEIDKMELIKNILKINKVFAVMPDGLTVKIDNNAHYNLEYPLPNPSEFEKNNLSIYLTIPKLISDNYLQGKYPRYMQANYADILNIHTGEDPIEITKMLPNISIHSDIDLNSNFTTLKIAHLKVDKNLWGMNEYIPPTLKINSTDNPLYNICADICYSMRKKIHHLSDIIFSKTINTQANFISENLLFAQGLGIGLPYLEGLIASMQAHPFQLYLGLCKILGGLGLLTTKLAPPPPCAYLHEDILLTFQKLKYELDGIINTVINENISQTYFRKEENIYTVNLSKDYITNNSLMVGLKKKPSCLESDFLVWVKNCILCDADQIELTIQNRTLGYQRERIERTEDILPTKGVYLFKVSLDNMINDTKKLALFNHNDTLNSPEEIFIYIKHKTN